MFLFYYIITYLQEECLDNCVRLALCPILFLSKKVLIYGKIGSLLYEEMSCQTSLKF